MSLLTDDLLILHKTAIPFLNQDCRSVFLVNNVKSVIQVMQGLIDLEALQPTGDMTPVSRLTTIRIKAELL